MSNTISISDAKIILKKGEGRTIKAGGLWVFDNEIAKVTGSYENGDIVEVHDFDDFFLGYGFINDISKIRVRLMSRKKDNKVDEALIRTRVQNAWDYRKTIYGFDGKLFRYEGVTSDSCRLIFGEADFLVVVGIAL